MKFLVAVIAFCGVLALAMASPKPQLISPYGPQGIYGGGGAAAYGMADASRGLYGNNPFGPGILPGILPGALPGSLPGILPGYPGLGGRVPGCGGFMPGYPY